MSEFIWTENLVKEFLTHRDSKRRLWEDFENFKQSKQQSKNNQDWEILSFYQTKTPEDYTFNFIYPKANNGLFTDGFVSLTEAECLSYKEYKIHSVKVLSSGEIFSVGDKVADLIGDYYSDKSIAAFKIQCNDMFVIMNDLKGTFLIQHIQKAKSIMENKKQTVTVEIDDAANVASDLADLLCWWEGFNVGRQSAGTDYFMVAENGISAARNLNEKIKAALK